MEVVLNFLSDFFAQPTLVVIGQLFYMFGWTIFAWMLLYVLTNFWADYQEGKATANWKWVIFAVDIPALNVQTPKAVEQMFSHLAGALDTPDIADKFRHGHKQRWFSFEIVSIEGYIQFVVRTEETLRDLVEAAIYAQYPEAEITEIEDYVDAVPQRYPSDTHDLWAVDFGLAEHQAYPIRSYREFEHAISKDTVLKDPMGTFLESFSRIGPGEQMWFQIIVQPISNSWKEDSIKKIKELIGEKTTKKSSGVVSFITDNPLTKELGQSFAEINSQLTGGGGPGEADAKKDKPEEQNKLKYFTPGQTKILEGMEDKIMKLGFKTKLRGVYVARKEVFRPQRGVQALIGAINQFNIPSANSIVPKFGVKASYFFKEYRVKSRKNLLIQAYKKRKMKAGATPYVLNIEELASIWHFPMSHVATPLIQKATGKRAEPPIGLPVDAIPDLPLATDQAGEPTQKDAPEQKGYQTDSGDVAYSDDYRLG